MRTSDEARRGIDCMIKNLGSDLFKLMLEMSGIPSLLMRTSAEAKRGNYCRLKNLGSDMFQFMLEVCRLATYIWYQRLPRYV